MIIRFEMPYNIWCDGCKNHIGMGVRYNAEKSKIGMYYTTPLYKFRMKCHLCDNHFEIKTDPANHDYVIISGARRKEQRYDPKDNEQIETEDKSVKKKLATDAMFKLEHGVDDKAKVQSVAYTLDQLEEIKAEKRDDYMLNRRARDMFRKEKRALKDSLEADNALIARSSLGVSLVPEKEEDVKLAGLMKYASAKSYDEKQQEKRQQIESRPLFQSKTEEKLKKNKALQILHSKGKLGHQESPFSLNSVTISPLTGIVKQKNKGESKSRTASKETVINNKNSQNNHEPHTADCKISGKEAQKNALGSLMDNYDDSESDTNT
ncbi:coiled-coil domain-containing protein 130 isoform X2 [Lingula anatina]|nr:coiled-coil domain-containing protein 130 isoform X2 [Lingula anatina]|eukprot:XP_013387619.1 coiled-coil domain-containing protein 130 isoform X2 [Lingula anatina]